jgi:hypothetical protein
MDHDDVDGAGVVFQQPVACEAGLTFHSVRTGPCEEDRMNLAMARRYVSALALVVATVALFAVISTPAEVQAATYSCTQGSTCPHQASCDGAYFDRNGCSVTCFIMQGEPGELQAAGSASCGGSGGGGGGGGGGDWWCGSEWCW